MTSILFIQGGGDGTHDEWDNKLVDSLAAELGPGFDVRYPRMPNEGDPKYKAWARSIRQELAALSDGSVLVGHSIGAAILINALAEMPPRIAVAGIFLIAPPFVGEGGWASDEFTPRALGPALPTGVPVFLYWGSDDDTVPAEHIALYETAIPGIRVKLLEGRDHQLSNDLAEMARDIRDLPAK